MSDDDGLVPIPPEFWANFGEEGVLAEKQEGPLVRRSLYADRQTYEDWGKGDFVVWHNDGKRKEVNGVMLNRADLERLFPPKGSGNDC